MNITPPEGGCKEQRAEAGRFRICLAGGVCLCPSTVFSDRPF